ncbi:MAG: hypothetical protein JXR97_06400 [Planctomycetes bacterium]|nr:hypothetical protein [Planctomycetota bacterium]
MKVDAIVILSLLSAMILLGGCGGSTPDTSTVPELREGFIEDPRITECSGAAFDEKDGGIFWLHNDSGDTPRIFGVDEAGRTRCVVEVEGAEARDWEDICAAKMKREAFLIIADTGDNPLAPSRRNCSLYLLPKPRVSSGNRVQKVRIRRRLDFTYEDGPRDCESVAYSPKEDAVYLASKSPALNSQIYRLSLDSEGVMVAKKAWLAPVSMPTGMDISPDGLRMVILNYGGMVEYVRNADSGWASLNGATATPLKIPVMKQAEAVCYGRASKTIHVISEQIPAKWASIRVR